MLQWAQIYKRALEPRVYFIMKDAEKGGPAEKEGKGTEKENKSVCDLKTFHKENHSPR